MGSVPSLEVPENIEEDQNENESLTESDATPDKITNRKITDVDSPDKIDNNKKLMSIKSASSSKSVS